MLLKDILEEITQNNEHPFRWDVKGFYYSGDGVFAVDIAKKDFKLGDELFINTITGEISKSGDLIVGIVDMEHPLKPYWIVNDRKIYNRESLMVFIADAYSRIEKED